MFKKITRKIGDLLPLSIVIVFSAGYGANFALEDFKTDHSILVVQENDAEYLNNEVRKKWPNELASNG